MSAQNTLAFDLRKWEAQTLTKFDSVKGTGRNWVEIKLPPHFIYGNYVHLRDILFLYGNTYDALRFEYIDVFGSKERSVTIHLSLYGTGQGKAVFLDEVLKPVFHHRYYYRLIELPIIPEEYGLFHKLHYRILSQEAMAKQGKNHIDFFLSRLINRERSNDYWKFLNEPVIPHLQPAPICKHVCYVCKKMYDLKQLYTFVLEEKKHHICHTCYDEIPLTTMDKITLKKV